MSRDSVSSNRFVYTPGSWSELQEAVKSTGRHIDVLSFVNIDEKLPNAEIATRFTDSILETKRLGKILHPEGWKSSTLFISGIDFQKSWPRLLSAIFARTDIESLALVNCGLDDTYMGFVANWMEQTAHLSSIRLQDNPGLSKLNIQRIVNAACKFHPNIKRLQLTDGRDIPIGPETVESLVRIKHIRCQIILGSGGVGRFLESLIAMNSIYDARAEAEVQKHQLNILRLFVDGHTKAAVIELQKLKDSVAQPEHDRILALLPALVDKYAMIGGLELMATVPADYDRYKGETPLTQFIALAHLDQTKDVRVRSLLAIAAYKQTILTDVCSYIQNALKALAATCETFLVPAVVDAFLEEYQLCGVSAELRAFDLTFELDCPAVQYFSGCYVQVGFYKDKPCFERKAKDGADRLFLFSRVLVSKAFVWVISKEGIGSDHGSFRLQDGIDLVDGKQEWVLEEGATVSGTLTPAKHTVYLRDGLVAFLKQRASDTNLNALLSLGNELVRLSMGPPKNFTRAMDKGSPEQLKDLNRCTFEFESVAFMVLAFHLLRSKVEQLNGSITRLSNLFMKDVDFVGTGGLLHSKYYAPPVMHLFIQISGWTFEVMLALVDVMDVKKRLHKFYNIVRAENVEQILMPVFDASQDFCTDVAAGNAMNAVRQR